MKKTFNLLIMFFCLQVAAQEPISDTIRREAVIVKGFETGRPLLTTAAPVYVATQKDFNRYPGTSLVPVVNQSPGVRMEERSPGSYRLSVRGSLLRSPFGVRNIKVYLAGIPFTDAGGNTYISLLDVQMMERLEILKGPSGITYGAGTGGTLLLNETGIQQEERHGTQIQASINGGSYNSFGEHLRVQQQENKYGISVQQSRFQSDGYREHSALRRDAVMFQTRFQPKTSNQWNLFLLYGNLHYETPGGITLEQMNLNPRLSRQRSGAIPSAMEQHAGIYQQTLFSGISHKYIFNPRWQTNTSVFFAYTDFANPFITNYETRFETSGGGRSVVQYKNTSARFVLSTGVEAAITKSTVTNFGNRGGQKDTLQNKDYIDAIQAFAFVQTQTTITKNLLLDAGFSVNHFAYQYERVYAATGSGKRTFNAQWLPRAALLYRLTPRLSLYTSIGRGYSPPTIAEVRPDNQVLNTTLQPEAGTNTEAGLRGHFFNGRLFADVSAYHFRLRNTIVRRTSAAGDYFINAGSTKQKGIEFYGYSVVYKGKKTEQVKIFTSITLNHYHFNDYTIASSVFDGKKITGVPGETITMGADVFLANGWYLNATGTYTSSLPLTDDNLVTAESFYLLGCRAGYRCTINKFSIDVFAAGNNLLNERYSPGNDLNALGKRYYNPGAARNFTAGVKIKR